jgi:hypothetical protein
MPFDIDGARQAGYGDDQIEAHLSSQHPNFDFEGAKNAGYTLDQISAHLTTQKGGESYEESSSSQGARQEGDAQRSADQQVGSPSEEGVQSSEEYRQGNEQVSEWDNQADLIGSKSEKGGELIEEKQTNGEGASKGQENGQGLRVQEDARNKGQVTTEGVQPPDQGGIIYQIAKKAAQDPTKAAIAAGASAAETGLSLKAGQIVARTLGKSAARIVAERLAGSVAAAIAAPVAAAETVATGGIGALAAPVIEMTAFAGGAYLGGKAIDFVEKLIGVDKYIQEAKQANTELAEAAGLAAITPMAVSSIKNLSKLSFKKAAAKVAAGAVGGAAFEPIRYGVESVLAGVTGSEPPEPMTAGSTAKSALMGGVFGGAVEKERKSNDREAMKQSGIAAAAGAMEIEKTVGPETARAAVAAPTDESIKASASEAKAAEVTAHPVKEVKTETPPEADASQSIPKQKELESIPLEEQRLSEAAFVATNPETGEKRIFTGANHDEALEKAKAKGFISEEYFNEHYGNGKAKARNKEEFGFLTDKGKFVSREDAYKIAKNKGQLMDESKPLMFPSEKGGKVHSNEVKLDKHPAKFKGEIETEKLHGLTVKEALRKASNHSSASKEMRGLLKEILKFGSPKMVSDKIGILSEAEALKAKGSREVGSVNIPEKGKVRLATLVHEAMHTNTADSIELYLPFNESQGLRGQDYVNWLDQKTSAPSVPQEIKRMADLYKSAYEQLGGASGAELPSAMENIHEFISNSFANEKFQNKLKELKGDGGETLWAKFVNLISQLFNVPENSLAKSVMDASFSIAGMKEAPAKKGFTLYSAKEFRENPSESMKTDNMAAMEESIKDVEGKDAVSGILNGEIPEPETPKEMSTWNKFLKATHLFDTDLSETGSGSPVLKPNPNLIDGLNGFYHNIANILDGETIPNLSKAGVKVEATQHACSSNAIDPYSEGLLAEAFPEIFFSPAEMYNVGRFFNMDNVLGGHAAIIDERNSVNVRIEELKMRIESGEKPAKLEAEIAELEEKGKNLSDSLQDIEDAHDLPSYEEEVKNLMPEMQKYVDGWKEKVQPLLDDLYKRQGDTENAPQEQEGKYSGVRINILSEAEVDYLHTISDPSKQPPVRRVVNYRNPDVKAVRTKTAQYSAAFSNDLKSVLMNSLASRMNEATKLDLYKALQKKGVAKIVDPFADIDEKGNKITEIGGKKIAQMVAKMPVTDKVTGKTVMRDKWLLVQEDLVSEIEQVLNIYGNQSSGKFLKAITAVQVLGFADALNHTKGILGKVSSTLGRDSRTKDWISKIPLVGSANAILEIRQMVKRMYSQDPKIKKTIGEISKNIGLRPNYEATGVLRHFSMHHLLHDWDTAARLILAERYENLVKQLRLDPSPEGKINFVNSVGEYNNRLQPRWIASLRNTGISPFLIGGTSMMRISVQMALGQKGFKAKSMQAAFEAHAMQVSSLVACSLIPALINLGTTGSMGGRSGTPIGAIDFGPSFDTEEGKRRVFDLMQVIGLRRGYRALGLNAAIGGMKDGLTSDEAFKNVANDVLTSNLHPFIGPGIGFGYELLTGKRIDMRGGWAETFDARKIGGPMQYVENFRVGLKQQNPLLYGIGAGAAIEQGMKLGGIQPPSAESPSDTLKDMGLDTDSIYGRVAQSLWSGTLAPAASVFGAKIIVSPALKLSAQLGTKQQYSPEQDARYAARELILKQVKKGNVEQAKSLYVQGIRDGILTPADKKTLSGKIKQPDILLQRVSRLKTAEDALSVFAVAQAEEQDKIASTVWKKIRGSSALTPAEQMQYVERFKSFTRKGTAAYNYFNK